MVIFYYKYEYESEILTIIYLFLLSEKTLNERGSIKRKNVLFLSALDVL